MTEREDLTRYDDDTHRAWLTIIDEQGKVRHRNLEQVPEDLIGAEESAVQELSGLKAAEVPPEKSVREGMWINLKDKQIGFWGGAQARCDLKRLQQSWKNWDVHWAEQGYADQCAVSGLPGVPMTDTEALPDDFSCQMSDVDPDRARRGTIPV